MSKFMQFLNDYKKRDGTQLQPYTKEQYENLVTRHFNPHEMSKMNREELFEYVDKHVDSAPKRASYSMFLRFLRYPEEKIATLKRPDKVTREIQSKVLSRAELKRLFNEVDDEMKLLIAFMYDTACRRSELLNIKYGDIAFRDTNTAQNVWAEVNIVRGKGGKSRTVYLQKSTVLLLRQLRPHIGVKDKVFYFYKDKDNPYINQEHRLYVMIKDTCDKILGRHIHPHCFRHSKLTHLANTGADVLGISRYAGHKDIKTSQIYIDYSTYISETTFEKYSRAII